MKKFFSVPFLIFLMCGCCCTNFNDAQNMIREGKAECVVIRNNRIVAAERGKGLNPLLKIYDEKGLLLQKAFIADKVIGRAAAFIIIKGGAAEVFGKIMSEDAKLLLEQHNIKVSFDLLVPRILNNQRNGLCPLEDSVKNITSPNAALQAMRLRLKELRKK